MKNSGPVDMSLINDYYKEKGSIAIYGDSFLLPFNLIKGVFNRSVEILSKHNAVRRIASLLRVRATDINKAQIRSEQYFAMTDALLLLAKKNVPVYYYNRVGMEKTGFTYSDSAKNRMAKRWNFPYMLEHIDEYERDFKELFGDLYDKDYINSLGVIPQVIKKGEVYKHEDCKSRYVNVIEGHRVVCSQPEHYRKTVHVYGRCGAFGYAVEDKNSLPSIIQRLFFENGISDVRVVNHGLWGGEDEYLEHNFLHDCLGYKEGDIVLFYMKHIEQKLLVQWEKKGVFYKDITYEWHQYPEAKWCFFDRPGHMNHIGYEHVAEIIVKDLMSHSLECKNVEISSFEGLNTDKLNAYLKKNEDEDFHQGITEYINAILKDYPLGDSMQNNGAIVMNCNPFTKGHRFLIEQAAKQVDRLYIFVVKEDKSFFRFEDRFEMVKLGTEDIKNVVVVSSGKFIISSLTFPEYFMKDYVKEKDFDVSMDVETFCKYIAPPLNIKKRFAGEEPFDPVTSNYNMHMNQILPKYAMEFCEIKRLALDEERVVNATEVRRLLGLGDMDGIKEYVPQSTYDILINRYSN